MSKPSLRPSPGLLIALLALGAALAGSAYAGSQIGTRDIVPKAVTGPKIANGAIHTIHIGNGRVTGPKLADGIVSESKLADGAVTGSKLEASQRAEAFTTNQPADLALNLDTGSFTDLDRVAALSLPAGGHFVVSAQTSVDSNGATARVSCALRDDGGVITRAFGLASTSTEPSATIGATATVDGGAIDLVCQSDVAATARNRVITATRVATVQAQ